MNATDEKHTKCWSENCRVKDHMGQLDSDVR